MSALWSLDVQCDVCGCWGFGSGGALKGLSIRRARAAAKKALWIRKRVKGRMMDICFECSKAKKKRTK